MIESPGELLKNVCAHLPHNKICYKSPFSEPLQYERWEGENRRAGFHTLQKPPKGFTSIPLPKLNQVDILKDFTKSVTRLNVPFVSMSLTVVGRIR